MQLTVKDVARLLGTSEKSVYRWMRERGLPAHRVGGQFRFNRAELIEWATAQKVNVSPQIFEEPEAAGPLPTLADALETGGVFYRITGANKEAVLASVVEYLRLPEGADRRLLLQMLIAREKLASTAIGDGIALPHPRHPIVFHMDRPLITLCFLERPVDFGALDGKPVHAVFTLVSPTVRGHLHLLSRLAFALKDESFKQLIQEQAGREQILAAARELSRRFDGVSPNDAQS
ncbi:PTS sugar transporter subunit IIA [Limisphaera sp. 4302-co]|uniref:PTS sugar transporter subunit IIA n=1 Tax=Limisphaera sp. 4302-co TaxID=3400417 RepID=UPI003C29165C